MTAEKAIMNLKAILMARLCSAQEDPAYPIVTIDNEAKEAIQFAIDALLKKEIHEKES